MRAPKNASGTPWRRAFLHGLTGGGSKWKEAAARLGATAARRYGEARGGGANRNAGRMLPGTQKCKMMKSKIT